MTLQDAAACAISCQDGCNSRGIARTMIEAMDCIADQPGYGTRGINEHPIVFMFLYKLMALNGHESLDMHMQAAYNAAESACTEIAAGV